MYQTSCCFIDYLSIENWHTIILYCRLMDCLPFELQPTHTECITDGVSSHFECPEEFSFMRTTTEAFWVCGQVCVALIAFSSCTVTEWVTYISLLSIGVSVSWLHSDSSSWTRGFNKGPVPTDSLHRALKRKKKKGYWLQTNCYGKHRVSSTLVLEYWLNSFNRGVWESSSSENIKRSFITVHAKKLLSRAFFSGDIIVKLK